MQNSLGGQKSIILLLCVALCFLKLALYDVTEETDFCLGDCKLRVKCAYLLFIYLFILNN